ncbi:hypothetical protein PV394_32485 [Streptomyces sp. NE06-03E]|uniref:hypothetical protein n=1 Tax=Streptomyces sp. NE06-03E TaxID=3028695 RepID=UPI0029AE17FE|nr:hypothetical protein [Streptomyces sp. NE06-03E]MDX3059797.1 hypothetical protein [Streptomyces sp. NE06-03E]
MVMKNRPPAVQGGRGRAVRVAARGDDPAGVEVVRRHGSAAYAEVIRRTVPDAVQASHR